MSSYIVSIHRKDQTLTREVATDSFSVGRSVDCDISLSDNQISRVHLTVSRQGNDLLIEDRNSSNGTFVNDEKITAGVAIVVGPNDRIQLGKSEYSLFIELKMEPLPEEAPPVFEDEEPELEPTMAMPPPQMTPLQAEKILHEAKRQAAQIILEGETQAEKRVQAIYQKARADQAQAEQYYQNRLSEANKEADRILEEYKHQGQTLLQDARRMSQEMREEVDHYVQTLREKSKRDAETLLQESQAQADRLRAETFAQTREDAKNEANEIVQSAKEEAQRLAEFTRLQTKDLEERLAQDTQIYNQLSQQLKETQENLDKSSEELHECMRRHSELQIQISAEEQRISQLLQEEKERVEQLLLTEKEETEKFIAERKQASEEIIRNQDEKVREAIRLEEERVAALLKIEEERVAEIIRSEEERVAQILSHEESRIASLLAEEKARVDELLNLESTKIAEMRNEEALLRQSKEALAKSIEEHQLKQGKVIADLGDLEKRFLQLSKDYEAEKIRYAEKISSELSQQKKNADERKNAYELELNKNLQQMEKKMLDEILTKKQELIKNIHTSLEQELVKVVPQEKWASVSGALKEIVSESFEGRMATLAQESTSVKSIDKLVAQKRNEKIRWMTMGLAMGMLVLFVGQTVLVKMRADQSPLQSMTLQAAQKRQEELEARKFNPAQTDEVRESFTDSVIYTSNFVSVYTDPVYQEKMYKAASQYLLKTWRVDEDKSIQVLAIATALVKDLADRRSKIHPDFVKEGIDKMKAAESESLLRMKDILGTEVRVESFRRFDRNFYSQELKNRKMAHH